MIKNELHKHFIAAQAVDIHPVLKSRHKLRANYYYTLEHFVTQCSNDNKFVKGRLKRYYEYLAGESSGTAQSKSLDSIIYSIVNNMFKPWRRKYRYWLLCDLAIVLSEEQAIRNAFEMLKRYLSKRQRVLLENLLEVLLNAVDVPKQIEFAKVLIDQFHENRVFIDRPEKRFMVTANMSAGKSTLINALVGKPVTRTSQEACTANLCFLYNKPFDDNAVYMYASEFNPNATYEELMKGDGQRKSCVASYFNFTVQSLPRVCLIDTPGANSAVHLDHGQITRKSLLEEKYDVLIYVFNGNKLGTDEELRYLKHVSEIIPKEKIVFVLNKLDDYKDVDDSIESSLEGVRNDLVNIGYDNPKICPISAYFALLLKMKKNGHNLTEDELDAYELFVKKFTKQKYDLSRYYAHEFEANIVTGNDFLLLSAKCGLHGLETVLFGA